ncbi:hypothetical protein D3C86_1534330 [compost metagenome]
MSGEEVGKARQQEMSRQRALHLQSQQPFRLRAVEGALGVLDVVQDGQAAPVVGLAVQRRPDYACGPLQQPDSQPPLQIVDDLGHRRSRHLHVVRRQRKAAPLHHPRKQSHCVKPVHPILRRLFPCQNKCGQF